MRVSNHGMNQDLIYRIQNNTSAMDRAQKQMSTGQRNERASDDPMAAINSIYYRVRSNRIDQYARNIEDSRGQIAVQHDTMSAVTDLLQRSRELAVQSANGTLMEDDRRNIAMEVNEMIEAAVGSANTRYKDSFVFSGAKTDTMPFAAVNKSYQGMAKPMIEKVEYRGNDISQSREIDQGDMAEVTLAGSRAFWGDNHMVVSMNDGRNYVAASDQKIRIDGQDVSVKTGDSLDTIVASINQAAPSVRAFKQNLPDGSVTLGLESSYPHKMFVEDLNGGSVLQDLGIVRAPSAEAVPGNNIHPNTVQSEGSVFDVLIRFRNSLLDNDSEKIGSRDLASISTSLGRLLETQAKISAVQTRMDGTEKKLAVEKEAVLARLSKNEDMDMAEASINFTSLANVHQVSLMTAAKMSRPTLMDYLK